MDKTPREEAFIQINKDFSYLADMRKSYSSAMKKLENSNDADAVAFIAIDNIIMALEMVLNNMATIINIAQELVAEEKSDDRFN